MTQVFYPPRPLANPTALIGLSAVNGTAQTAMRSDAAPTIDQTAAFAFTGLGATTISQQGSGVSALTLTGGTITVNAPLINANQTWNNAAVSFGGLVLNITPTAAAAGSKIFDIQASGVSKVYVDQNGSLFTGAIGIGTGGTSFSSASNLHMGASTQIDWSTLNAITAPSDGTYLLQNHGGTNGFYLTTVGSSQSTLQLGPAAIDTTPADQIFQVSGVLTGGTDNQRGANATFAAGQGKGNVAAGFIFSAPTVGASGNTLQTMATVLDFGIGTAGQWTTSKQFNFNNISVTGGISMGNSNPINYSARFGGSSHGQMLFDNGSGANFSLAETASNIYSLGTASAIGGVTTPTLSFNTSTGAIAFPQGYTTAGLLQNDASGNVTTNTAVVASTIPANFVALDRLTVVISGTTYYIPLATVAF